MLFWDDRNATNACMSALNRRPGGAHCEGNHQPSCDSLRPIRVFCVSLSRLTRLRCTGCCINLHLAHASKANHACSPVVLVMAEVPMPASTLLAIS